MDESIDSTAPSDAFRVARKGYDRQQVDAHVAAASRHAASLEHRIAELEAGLSELGLNRPTDLATELDLVGEEVKRILAEARVAAEQMRSRAADDAARWRAEADAESRVVRDATREAAFEVRRSAWETGTELLAAAVAEGEALASAAIERSLFVQAEAEREASHLTADARRERDESIRAGREEAERLVSAARKEAEALVSAARRQADAAQERARALEVRRSELMAELESARATIAGVEPEPEPELPAVEPVVIDDAAAVVLEGSDGSHWPDDEGSVKIVSADRVLAAEPVDADAMVAEVQALRQTPVPVPPIEERGDVEELSDDAGGLPQPEPAPEPVSSPGLVPPIEERGDVEELSDDAGGLPQPEPAPEPVSSPGLVPPIEERGDVEELSDDAGGLPQPEPAPEPAPELAPEPAPSPGLVPPSEERGDVEELSDDAGGLPQPEPAPDPLAGLFARLRATEVAAEPVPVPPIEERGDVEELSDDAGGLPQPESAPSPASVAPTEERGDVEELSDDAGGLPQLASESTPADVPDPFALRERLLLPIQNRALRTVKRHLVEAQNRSLEDLRLADGWEPDASIVSDEVVESLKVLAQESMVAGFAAAAEMTGAIQTPQPDAATPGDPSVEFTAALVDAARAAVARSRETGAGHREAGATLSRVFRSWRTDDAERRVRFASRAAYHSGVTAALADLGSTEAVVVATGHPCADCPASKGPWSIAAGPPSGTMMPPARLECACTVVPSP